MIFVKAYTNDEIIYLIPYKTHEDAVQFMHEIGSNFCGDSNNTEWYRRWSSECMKIMFCDFYISDMSLGIANKFAVVCSVRTYDGCGVKQKKMFQTKEALKCFVSSVMKKVEEYNNSYTDKVEETKFYITQLYPIKKPIEAKEVLMGG